MSTLAPTTARNVYQIPDVQVVAHEKIKLVTPSSPMSEVAKLASVASLISTLGSRPPTHLGAVETVINILNLALPELGRTLVKAKTITIETRSMSEGDILKWLWVTDPEGGEGRPEGYTLINKPKEEALGVTTVTAVYAGVASVLFGMGRQASESSSAASIDKRPDALIRRFDIPESDQGLLPGRVAGPSREALEVIYNAFSTYTELRSLVVSFFIGVKRGSSHYPLHLEVLMTNFQLMRGAGMTHVDAVMKLANMHPWTLRIPELEPFWKKFTKDLVAFDQIDGDVRPYHRMMVGQSDYLFISSELRPLIAVAGSFVEEVEKTFSGYVYNAGSYSDLIDKVRSYAPHYVNTTGLANLAALLDVPDVPLPARRAPPTTSAPTIV